jgi:SAM-dependent methyltransferase
MLDQTVTTEKTGATEFYKAVAKNKIEAGYYNRYLDFVTKYSPPGGRILELGCGAGLSSTLLARRGFKVTGVDLTRALDDNFLLASDLALNLVQADVTLLPFASESFDIVCSFDVLEHVPAITNCLEESLRVLRPGGRLIIVGPNLLSPLFSLTTLAKWATGRGGFQKAFGPPQDYIIGSPWGTTGPGMLKILGRNLWYLFKTLINREALFFTRVPDYSRPPHGDIDSVILTNPIFFKKYLRKSNFQLIKYQGEGKTGKLGGLAGGVWLVAQKPAQVLKTEI